MKSNKEVADHEELLALLLVVILCISVIITLVTLVQDANLPRKTLDISYTVINKEYKKQTRIVYNASTKQNTVRLIHKYYVTLKCSEDDAVITVDNKNLYSNCEIGDIIKGVVEIVYNEDGVLEKRREYRYEIPK